MTDQRTLKNIVKEQREEIKRLYMQTIQQAQINADLTEQIEAANTKIQTMKNHVDGVIEGMRLMKKDPAVSIWFTPTSIMSLLNELETALYIPRSELKEKPECATCDMCQCDVMTDPDNCYKPNWKAPRSEQSPETPNAYSLSLRAVSHGCGSLSVRDSSVSPRQENQPKCDTCKNYDDIFSTCKSPNPPKVPAFCVSQYERKEEPEEEDSVELLKRYRERNWETESREEENMSL